MARIDLGITGGLLIWQLLMLFRKPWELLAFKTHGLGDYLKHFDESIVNSNEILSEYDSYFKEEGHGIAEQVEQSDDYES